MIRDTLPGEPRTVMVRHYTLESGTCQLFLEWWRAHIPALRERAGFTIAWAYLDRVNETFTWAVSYPGDEVAFSAAEAVYEALPERVAAIGIAPPLRALSFGVAERVR